MSKLQFLLNKETQLSPRHVLNCISLSLSLVLGMTRNYIWSWGSNTIALWNMEYSLSLQPGPTLPWSRPGRVLIMKLLYDLRIMIIGYLKPYGYEQIIGIRSEYLIELLMSNSNTWNHITAGKQMINNKENCLIGILETVWLCASKWDLTLV